jgi:hypothetical protein
MPSLPAVAHVRGLRDWLRRRSIGSGIVSTIVVVAAIVAILNDLPDLFDKSLPWLGDKVNLGLFVATTWQIAWIIPLLLALGLLGAIYRNSRTRPAARSEPHQATSPASATRTDERPQAEAKPSRQEGALISVRHVDYVAPAAKPIGLVPIGEPTIRDHPLNDLIDARNDGRKLRGRLTRPWDEELRQEAQAFTNRCRALGRKWPEHREAIDRAIDRPLPTPLKPNATAPTSTEIMEALQTSTIDRLQAILVALDHLISPPSPITEGEFVRRCNQYIVIGGQITARIRGTALDATEAERLDLGERVHGYLSEVLLFLNERRPKYWLRLAEVLNEPAREVLGYADALCERIDRVVRTLRVAVDES